MSRADDVDEFDTDADAMRRVEEGEALVVIYGDARARADARSGDVALAVGGFVADVFDARAELILPRGYPSRRAPCGARVTCQRNRNDAARAVEAWASDVGTVEGIWTRGGGEPCAFAWLEATRERLEEAAAVTVRCEGGSVGVDVRVDGGGEGAEVAVEDPRRASVRARLTSHESVTEKKSVFQAHVCRNVASVEEVAIVMDVLREDRRFRAATHNIMAYRIARRGGDGSAAAFYQDYDDDGETAAGGRLLRLLTLADARDVVVVVSRWYGGVQLGPLRFHVINATAKAALESLGEIHAAAAAK